MKLSVPSKVINSEIKINPRYLFYLLCFSIILLGINLLTIRKIPKAEYPKMTDATAQMNIAIREINAYKGSQNILQSLINDPAKTGFIGVEYSPITTTLGNLEAKQTSVNPDFAALMVHWLKLLKKDPGETVVIHTSGSFPALGIAAIIACEKIGLEPIILSSAGASSFGANLPNFTYWDMENLLWRKGIIKHHTDYATPGGENDNGSSLTNEGKQILENAANRNQLTMSMYSSLEESINNKWQFIQKFKPLSVFINIGGNQAAMGNNKCSLNIPNGLIRTTLNCNESQKGLIHLFNQQNIPVIHFLNIRDIALQNGITLTSSTFPKPSQSLLYYTEKKPVWLLIISFTLILVLLIYLSKKESE